MKLKRKRALEVPPKIKSFISSVTAVPLENIEETLKGFVWEFDKGDFHHWIDLFNHFDSFFEKHIKPRKDLQIEDNFLDSDPPFPKEAVLHILRVIRIILENCSNKHLYSSYEHLSSLLACTDADVVESCLQTLAAFLKKTIGKISIRDSTLNSKLYALAQGWGGKDEGLGLISCAVKDDCDPVTCELGCTLHFEFYALNDCENSDRQGLQIIHLPNVNNHPETDLELLSKLVCEFKVPASLRFSLLTRLRFARAFGSLAARQQYACIRLYAFIVLVQAAGDAEDLANFFNTEPEFVNELVSLLSREDAVPEKIRILCLLSLVALCQDRSRQPTVLTAVTSGGHRGILSSLMQKAIDSVTGEASKWAVVFAEALLSLVTVLVSSSSGCSAMRDAGFIPTILPLLKDTNPQHLHLVGSAVRILEVFMDFSNPAAALFRDLGGMDDTIARLNVEVSFVEDGSKQQIEEDSGSLGSVNLVVPGDSDSGELDDNSQPLYSEALVSHHRRLLMKALLRAISLGTYAPGSTNRVNGSEESLLPECLCKIFKRSKDFGGGVFSFAATVMSDLIHKDPTCFAALESAGLPSAFLDSIMEGVLCSTEAVACIPQCLDALCLNNNGLQAVKDRNALRCFVKIFTSRNYLRALASDTPGQLSNGLDELMRHAASLRAPGVDMLIEILNSISKIGSGVDIDVPSSSSNPSSGSSSSSAPVPMETDGDEKSLALSDDKEPSSESSFLPDCVINAARLLETILQNADICRIFIEKKGVEAVLQLFTLPLMPLSVSVGQSIAVAFKNFSPQHSAALARAVCSFLKEYLKSTNELLVSVSGAQLSSIESAKQTQVSRCLSNLESILSLCNFMLKGTSSVVSELGAADADVLKELGIAYREIVWQISLCNDVKSDEKSEKEPENAEAGSSSSAPERESDDDANSPIARYMQFLSGRGSSHPLWGPDRDSFLSVFRSNTEGLHRRTRHGLTRIRGGRTGRHLDSLNFDPDASLSSGVTETHSSHDLKKKSPGVLVLEILNKLASTIRSFFTSLVKGFTSPNRRRADSASVAAASKTLGSALAKIFLDSLNFPGHSASSGPDSSILSVKCRYLGKIVEDMASLTVDSRRRTCYTSMINNFYVHGTFKELLTTFEATSQLLWTLPFSSKEKSGEEGGSKMISHGSWLLDTLQSYCRVLENFVNSTLLLSQTASSTQTQLLVQPVAVGLSIGLFPVPRDPEVFVRMLQSQVLDVVLPIWNNPMFPNCNPGFIGSIVSLVTHVYSGAGDVKRTRNGGVGGTGTTQRFMPQPLDEATIATIVEMGFSRARAEEALRRVETNSVEMAMEWLFTHPEDPVQEDDELARALALSLGSSSETSKADTVEKSVDVSAEEGGGSNVKTPPVEDILSQSVRLFQSSDTMAFPLTDLLVTLCNRNKGEDRPKVAAYLVQELKKLCPRDFSPEDVNTLTMLAHTIALLLFEDGSVREVAASNGIVSAAIEILMSFKDKIKSGNEVLVQKCVSALVLILDNMLQSRPKNSSESTEGAVTEKKSVSDVSEKESDTGLESLLGKSTGYLTVEESQKVLIIACDLINQHVPAVIMQAVLQLCARLTKTHSLAMQFLENGGLDSLFNLPRICFFPGYDSVASAIVRHLLEDPQTLQTAMEWEIRQTLSGNRHPGRVSPRAFLTSMALVISRDPEIFLKAASAVCQLETSGGRTIVVLSKEKEKEKEKDKEKTKATGGEAAGVSITENKTHDLSVKCSNKGHHKKIPGNLTQVIDQLLDIVLKFPLTRSQEDSSFMEVDEPASKMKGKSKVDEMKKPESESDRSAGLAKVTFVLKLLSDILLMYVHAVGVILRRDLEISLSRDGPSNGGVLHHVLHHLLPLTVDKSAGPDEWRQKLSEKASWFLVVLSGRSSEGRRRVISELVKALSSFSLVESNSSNSFLLPDKRVFAFIDLVYSILSKNSSSSNMPGSGCSPDIAKSMIDGGVVQCLTGILQVFDLDHPDAPKAVNLILKSLESLTRAANTNDQILKPDATKRKSLGSNVRSNDHQLTALPAENVVNPSNDEEQQQVRDPVENQETSELGANLNQSDEQEMGAEAEEEPMMAADFIPEEIEGGNNLQSGERIDLSFHVENRAADDEMGDEDDDMVDEDDEEDDEDGEEDEDEDIVEEEEEEGGGGMLSLAESDGEDHNDDNGLGDDYNDEMIEDEDDDDDDFHENRVIEVRWREALDGLDPLHVLGQPGAAAAAAATAAAATGGLIDVAAEPFEGVNVDDLFGLRRSIGFDRRRHHHHHHHHHQTGRSSGGLLENGFQHPLLSRPPQSGGGDLASMSRDLDALSSGGFDVGHYYMFEAPVLPYDHVPASLFSDRLAGGAPPPPLTDYSVGMDSLQLSGRRGLGDGRWTDDGQPQANTNSASVAQAMEERFLSLLHTVAPAEITSDARQRAQVASVPERQQQPDGPVSNDSQPIVGQQQENSDQTTHGQIISGPENEQVNSVSASGVGEGQHQPELMEITVTDQIEETTADLPSTDVANPSVDVDMNSIDAERNENREPEPEAEPVHGSENGTDEPSETDQTEQANASNEAPGGNEIDPTFLEALPEDLRAEVLASQQAQSVQPPTYAPPSADDIDPEFLAALPPDIQAEVLAQQRAQRMAQQAEGQPVDMDNASIIATFPAELREEVLLTSSDAVLSALPSPLLAEAQMLRDRAMSHYQARSIFGGGHRINNRRNGMGFERQTVMDRGVGVTIGRRAVSVGSDSLKGREIEGEPLVDANSLKALIRLLRLAQPLGKGLLQRLLLNLCAHSVTRAVLVRLLLDMTKPEAEGSSGELATVNSQRLYGCHSNVVYGRSQLLDGLPPMVLQKILEILAYLATNHSSVANMLFVFDNSIVSEALSAARVGNKKDKGKEKVEEEGTMKDGDIPLILFFKLLNKPLFLHSTSHLEQVMGLLQVVVHSAAAKLERQVNLEKEAQASQNQSANEATEDANKNTTVSEPESNQENKPSVAEPSSSQGKKTIDVYAIFLQLPQSDLRNLCTLLGREGLSDKVYLLTGEVLKKLASVAAPHRKFFSSELAELAHGLSSSAVTELVTLRNTQMLGLSASSMAGAAILRVLQALSSLTVPVRNDSPTPEADEEEQATILKLNAVLEPLWQELSECISATEAHLVSFSPPPPEIIAGEPVPAVAPAAVPPSSPLPPGTQRLLPFIEAFFVLCEKLQVATEVKESTGASDSAGASDSPVAVSSSSSSGVNTNANVTFTRFSEKHRRLLNAFIRQNPGLLEKSLSMMLKAPRLIDFDNKKAYFRSRIRQQHEQQLSGPLRISVRRAYVLEDSYNQLRMRPTQDLKGRLNVQFQGEEGIDAGGLTREWYQLLSRVLFDKGALLFTTVGNNVTFQPNPNSVYQTEHLSYFKFVGRVVAKALFDGQLLDVYFTRSFYKHILGVKVTYHDIEAVDPDYYKNLKWLLENDVNDILDLTFSMDADEEKHILYEKNQVTDFELKPGGRNMRVTEDTKHEYVDLVADHILTNAIRPQINSFLEGFNELVPRELINIFNDKELELLISGLPEIDMEDLKANTEYTGYSAASSVIQWFWDVVKGFNKEDMAKLLQFVTGTSKVPLEGFKALQGISGAQRFQIHKAYGAPDRLPSAHTCFNQLDLPEYTSKEQLNERLLLAIHEASEGFGFG